MLTGVLGALQSPMEVVLAGRTVSVLPLVHLSGQEGHVASHQDSAHHQKE